MVPSANASPSSPRNASTIRYPYVSPRAIDASTASSTTPLRNCVSQRLMFIPEPDDHYHASQSTEPDRGVKGFLLARPLIGAPDAKRLALPRDQRAGVRLGDRAGDGGRPVTRARPEMEDDPGDRGDRGPRAG